MSSNESNTDKNRQVKDRKKLRRAGYVLLYVIAVILFISAGVCYYNSQTDSPWIKDSVAASLLLNALLAGGVTVTAAAIVTFLSKLFYIDDSQTPFIALDNKLDTLSEK